jgi:5-methylcytosine-specific restriction endonuclease McrA
MQEISMKLFDGWEDVCVPAPELGEGMYKYRKPGSRNTNPYKYTPACKGCGEPHLARLKCPRKGVYELSEYCTKNCWFEHRIISDESRAKWSYAGKNRSPEAEQHVLEANRRPRSAETLEKCRQSATGRKQSEESRLRQSIAATGVAKAPKAAEKSVLARRHTDREQVAANAFCRSYYTNASTKDRDLELTDDDMHYLITRPCYYCGIEPNTKKEIKSRGKIVELPPDVFYFHGIDRVDSNVGYIATNVVTACYDCNMAKSARTAPDFVRWALRVDAFIANRPTCLEYYGDIPNNFNSVFSTIWASYRRHRKAGCPKNVFVENTLTREQVATLVRTQCYYCGSGLSGKTQKGYKSKKDLETGDIFLLRNGLDRLDPNGAYEITNVVSCCFDCNRAKLQMSEEAFNLFVHRLAEHIRFTPELMALAT